MNNCGADLFYLHGFLGEADELGRPEVQGLSLLKLIAGESLPPIPPGATLMAYSMGGRFVLQQRKLFEERFSRIFLLSAHTGLRTPQEQRERSRWEDQVLQRLQVQNCEEFYTFWNQLPVFAEDPPRPFHRFDRNMMIQLFDNMRLSRQPLRQSFKLDADRYVLVSGERDRKYGTLYREDPFEGEKVVVPAQGHRLNRWEVIAALRERRGA